MYIFIDESGDTGLPGINSSKYFIVNILTCNTDSINKIEKHFSRYRYFRNADKEFKKYKSNKDSQNILNELCSHVSKVDGLSMYSFYIEKEQYIGPYLNKIHKTVEDYDSTKFRNFIIKTALKKVFEVTPVIRESDKHFRSIEIVIDRYLEGGINQQQLKKYFDKSYDLPIIQFINHVDSLYCTALQVVDVIGTMILCKFNINKDLSLTGIKLFEMNNPLDIINII